MNINALNQNKEESLLFGNLSIKNQNGKIDKKNQTKSNTFYIGDIKGDNQSKTDQIKEKFKSQAAKIVNNQIKNELEFADGIKEIEQGIVDLENEIKNKEEENDSLRERRQNIAKEYGIESGSEEDKKIELLKKVGTEPLTEEEQTKLSEMGEITDYQQSILDIDKAIDENNASIKDMYTQTLGARQSIIDMKLEKLQSHAMEDAYKEAEELLKEGNQQVIMQVVKDAKENIEEKINEAEEAKEEKEEKAEKENSVKEKQTENAEDKKTQNQSTNQEGQNNINRAERESQQVKEKIMTMAKESGLVEEDIKGIIVNQAL